MKRGKLTRGGRRLSSSASQLTSITKLTKSPPSVDNALWRVFSKWRRLLYADAEMRVQCCSCGRMGDMRDMDAGHFVPRWVERLRYVESNVWPQCRHCNRRLDGNLEEYALFLDREVGEGTAQLLSAYDAFPLPGPADREGMLNYYTQALARLIKDRKRHGFIYRTTRSRGDRGLPPGV